MHKILPVILLTFLSHLLFAQTYDPETMNHKATTIYNLANNKAQNGEYPSAIKMIREALHIEPLFVDAYLSLAGIYAEMKSYDSAVVNFEKAFSIDSVYSRHYLLPYSIDLAGTGHFNEALLAVNTFLSNNDLNERSRKAGEFRKRTYEFAVQQQQLHDTAHYNFVPVNLGDAINTAGLEYFPSITIDGKKMVITRRINGNEDFYESEWKDEQWTPATPLAGDINSQAFNEGAQNISQDGKWLVFTGCNFPEGMGNCDLYISFLTNKGWSTPQNLGPNVNSEFWESSPSLSPDKKDLYFSSSVPGGFGGQDIWVSHFENGKWSPALNLGPQINTAGDESTPFMHADNQTLYFNSNGHPGYSDKPDLYVTKKLNDHEWSTPKNLGYPINTIDDEGSMIVAADGKTAYYSSDRRNGKGGLDIYKFELRDDVRPLKTTWVKGQVFDANTKAGLPSTVELTDVESQRTINKLQTDESGNYLITLPAGKEYAFNVNRKGYLFYSENYNVDQLSKDSVFHADIPLQPLVANASVTLKNVFFDTKKTDLKPASIFELDQVVQLMVDNPVLKILITGHTDNIGKSADNLALSQGRAQSVVNYLLSKGINASRLSTKGLGSQHPVASNDTEEGRSLNRRTELKVLSN